MKRTITLTIKSKSWRAASKIFLQKVFVCVKIIKLRCNLKVNKLSTSSQAQAKTPKQSVGKILGGCVYSDSDALTVLPLVVVAVVEKFFEPLNKKV